MKVELKKQVAWDGVTLFYIYADGSCMECFFDEEKAKERFSKIIPTEPTTEVLCTKEFDNSAKNSYEKSFDDMMGNCIEKLEDLLPKKDLSIVELIDDFKKP